MVSRDWEHYIDALFKGLTYISRYGRTSMDATMHWPLWRVHRAINHTSEFLKTEADEAKKRT